MEFDEEFELELELELEGGVGGVGGGWRQLVRMEAAGTCTSITTALVCA